MEPGLELTLRCDNCGKQFSIVLSPNDMLGLTGGLPEGESTVTPLCGDCARPAGFGYTRRVGDRVRYGIAYRGTYRHLFWTRVSPAGDVYCTFGYGEYLESAATGETAADEKGVTVKYGIGETEVVGPLKGGRVSFHMTGQINIGDRQIQGKPLRDRKSQELLCTLVFEHPSAFPVIEHPDALDVFVPLEIDEHRALVGTVHLAPSGAPIALATGVRELGEPRWHSVVRYEGVTAPGMSDLSIQVVLGLGPRVEAWPPKSYLLVAIPRSE